jgi:hypothetical protein
VDILDEGVVERDAYPSFRTRVLSAPSLARVGDEILAIFRVGSAKVSPDGRIEARTSRDGGRTWVAMPSPFDGLRDGRNHVGSHLGGGDGRGGPVIAIASRFVMTTPGAPDWDDDRAGIVDADAMIARRDGDERWSAPVVLDRRRRDHEWAIGCGPAVSLGGGNCLQPMERHDRSDRPDGQQGYHAFALRSTDDGRTWPDEVTMPNDPSARLAHYDQRMTVLPDGRLATFAWIHDVDDDRTLHARAFWSADGGATWSPPAETKLLGGPINPLTLRDGRVLATYARRAPPAGVRVAFSADGGRTFRHSEEHVLYDGASRAVVGSPAPLEPAPGTAEPLWGTMWGWSFGSPCPLELADGSVLIAFFAVGHDGVSAIHCVRFRP